MRLVNKLKLELLKEYTNLKEKKRNKNDKCQCWI